MKVLDLDMDFFLSDACPLAPLGERPSENCAQPYTDEQVIAFLEEQCGLSREHPVPGLIFDTHDKALDFWRARMREGVLNAPFDVVHVDTHSDLAFGPPGTDFVLKAVLTRNPKSREALRHIGREKARRGELSALCAGVSVGEPTDLCPQSEVASGYSGAAAQ